MGVDHGASGEPVGDSVTSDLISCLFALKLVLPLWMPVEAKLCFCILPGIS